MIADLIYFFLLFVFGSMAVVGGVTFIYGLFSFFIPKFDRSMRWICLIGGGTIALVAYYILLVKMNHDI